MGKIVLGLIMLFSIHSYCQNAPELADEPIFNTATIQVKPEFPGAGHESMYGFIRKNYVVPQEIIDGKVSKKVFVTFVVEKDGSLSDLKVLRDVGFGSGEEALRVLKLMPKWIPGRNNGKPVRCNYSFPISLDANQ